MQLDLPKPMLGEISALTITSPDLETSLQYYQKLGFKEIMRMDFPFPWIQITDDALLIMLRKDNNPYLALTYYVKEIEKVVAEVESKEIEFISRPKPSDFVKRYLFKSPDGLNVSLVGIPDGFSKPAGRTMLDMDQSDYFKPETYTNKTIGMFGELAHPVLNLDSSIQFWEKIGFKVLSKFTSPYLWAILSDGLSIIGLHETTQYQHPAPTFFAADMKDKIENLKKQGLENYQETGPSNIILTTPEQQHIFLFKLGM
ncbi:MAG TPA: VOC family protein [Chitinophagaceae bacterium]|jgi:predicted lactoylglutathione lyase|nr:VOC family protein [Chitinophagaceae bacterium]